MNTFSLYHSNAAEAAAINARNIQEPEERWRQPEAQLLCSGNGFSGDSPSRMKEIQIPLQSTRKGQRTGAKRAYHALILIRNLTWPTRNHFPVTPFTCFKHSSADNGTFTNQFLWHLKRGEISAHWHLVGTCSCFYSTITTFPQTLIGNGGGLTTTLRILFLELGHARFFRNSSTNYSPFPRWYR